MKATLVWLDKYILKEILWLPIESEVIRIVQNDSLVLTRGPTIGVMIAGIGQEYNPYDIVKGFFPQVTGGRINWDDLI